MLTLAVVVPDTPLLVPGAAGRARVLDAERSAAVLAARAVVLAAPDRVVVVATGARARVYTGPVRASLAAAGISDGELGWAAAAVPPAAPSASAAAPAPADPADPVAGPGASVALLLLAGAGWSGPITVVEVEPPAPGSNPESLRALGRGLAAGPDRIALVAAGSLSARSGPEAPLAEDDRAAGVDTALLAALGRVAGSARGAERASSPPSSERAPLAGVTGALAAELAITAWAPLHVLDGALEGAAAGAIELGVPHVTKPLGVTYVVTGWGFEALPALPAGTGAGRDAAS